MGEDRKVCCSESLGCKSGLRFGAFLLISVQWNNLESNAETDNHLYTDRNQCNNVITKKIIVKNYAAHAERAPNAENESGCAQSGRSLESRAHTHTHTYSQHTRTRTVAPDCHSKSIKMFAFSWLSGDAHVITILLFYPWATCAHSNHFGWSEALPT